MALDIQPTRSELINLKRRIKQTQNGYNLLKMKRDGLFHEFRTLLSEMIAAKRELIETYRTASSRIALASALEGGLAVQSAALGNPVHPEVEVSRRNIMGVVVPEVKGANLSLSLEQRGTGLIGGSAYIDEAADAYGELIEKIVKAAEMESTLKRLLVEIEATKRRVNALEFKVIPEMEEARDFIQLRLEEMEREETFRLKRFKNKSGEESKSGEGSRILGFEGWPEVVGELETLELLVGGASISRFGDGEFAICEGLKIGWQKRNSRLASMLIDVLNSSGDCLVGIPNLRRLSEEKAEFWNSRMGEWGGLLKEGKEYHSSFISRPDLCPWIDNEEYYERVLQIWEGKKLVIMTGDDEPSMAVFNGAPYLYEGASEYEFWRYPSHHAFREYDAIVERCLKEPKGTVFAMCLGPTASALAHELCNESYQAIDLGSIPRFHRKFLNR